MKPAIKSHIDIERYVEMKLVHVQSVFPAEVRDALMTRANTTSIKDAILKAALHYIGCEENGKEK